MLACSTSSFVASEVRPAVTISLVPSFMKLVDSIVLCNWSLVMKILQNSLRTSDFTPDKFQFDEWQWKWSLVRKIYPDIFEQQERVGELVKCSPPSTRAWLRNPSYNTGMHVYTISKSRQRAVLRVFASEDPSGNLAASCSEEQMETLLCASPCLSLRSWLPSLTQWKREWGEKGGASGSGIQEK